MMDPPPHLSYADGIAASKLRLMCSFGGQIVARPRTKSLCYLGGETRIVSINLMTINTLSSFVSHLSTTLPIKPSFTVKYQLPHHDLDSLVSVSSDDDFLLMLEEHLRLSSTSSLRTPSRIRLFLFCSKPVLMKTQNVIHHPKTDSWFFDALNSAKRDCFEDFDGENPGAGGDGKTGGDMINGAVSLAESIVLETNSSFGSSSSSASLTNSPPTKVQDEDGVSNLVDNTIKAPFCESIGSDNCNPNSVSQSKSESTQELPFQFLPTENRLPSDPVRPEMMMHHTSASCGFAGSALSLQPNLLQQQAQFVQSGLPGSQQNLPGMSPILSYYPMHQPTLQPQLLHYHPNQVYPVYYVPVGHAQVTNPYNMPMQCGLTGSRTIASNQAPLPLNASLIPPHVTYQEVPSAPPPIPEPSSLLFKTAQVAKQPVLKSTDETQQQFGDFVQMHHIPQSTDAVLYEASSFADEFDEDPARAQIYKSQPPPPSFPPQHQTKNTAAPTVLLSEALAQLQMDNINQPIKLPQQ